MFAHRFLLGYFFYPNFYVSEIFTVLSIFYSIIYVSGNFPEIFITFQLIQLLSSHAE
jgi:hypothetical protein